MNPTDILSAMMLNNKKNELTTYLQGKEIEKLKTGIDKVDKRISDMYVIGDRRQFVNEVKSVSRATGKDFNEIYTLTYKQLLNDYGIDLKARVENKKKKIQEQRLDEGKKPLSPTTLRQKISCLSVVDEEHNRSENLWDAEAQKRDEWYICRKFKWWHFDFIQGRIEGFILYGIGTI